MDYNEKLKSIINSDDIPLADIDTFLKYFPELTESEDEKIRKDIIIYLQYSMAFDKSFLDKKYNWSQKDCSKWIAWLENQGEQKPADNEPKFRAGDRVRNIKNGKESVISEILEYVYGGTIPFYIKDQDEWELVEQKSTDKVEPKFGVGAWVVNNINPNYRNSIMLIVDYNNASCSYLCKHCDGQMEYSYTFIENLYHLWTIQDAKDGDVLRIKNLTFIFKEITNNNVCHKDAVVAYCSYEDNDDSFGGCGPDCITDLEIITPATKEQRDLLFSSMKDAGYRWDTELKQLIEIEQNSVWSEEDERIYRSITYSFAHNFPLTIQQQEFVKSLKDRYTWKPSKEQMKALEDAIEFLGCTKKVRNDLKSLYEQLKKLKGV